MSTSTGEGNTRLPLSWHVVFPSQTLQVALEFDVLFGLHIVHEVVASGVHHLSPELLSRAFRPAVPLGLHITTHDVGGGQHKTQNTLNTSTVVVVVDGKPAIAITLRV